MLESNNEINNTIELVAAPIAEQARISSVDVLRGFALLGILGMNIYAFGLPSAAYKSMIVYGGAEGLDRIVWYITHLFFDQKMMTIFSMLFGAGLILMNDRFAESGRNFKGFYYRRSFWLLIIALVHSYLIWFGDILFYYAIIGFFIYFFRNASARKLIIIGAVLLVIGIFVQIGIGTTFTFMRNTANEAQALLDEGEELDDIQEKMLDLWPDIEEEFNPTPEILDKEIMAYRGSYGENIKFRTGDVIVMQTQAFIFYLFWRIGAVMLIGMGLMKMGVFSALRSRKFYLGLIIIGYGIGLPIIFFGATRLELYGFDQVFAFREGGIYNYLCSSFVALGHIGLVMLFCRSNLFSRLKISLAAVGRMALTNYLTHSVVFTFIFYGYGLGLFAKLDRFELMAFVIGMWIIQIIISPIWLKWFQFGPAEWLWRSLTYSKRQPLRRR